ncbi:MerR family transcriptional regulator [Hahella sp. CR1]|uniref:MerR family transcriptional regulator n=1 Tax=Hahella sp. CR1 TaxID=2992807 RepID=UPI002442BCD3|nr:MerR family transcriptional regulator [Hahella sp. CR1]MDG9666764.1 MerR family transcriptional regulator [Hahella sp. CR1]
MTGLQLKVSEMAKRSGVTADTVRFYTKQGLLKPRRDLDNGYQLYDRDDLQKLIFAKKARQLGFSVKEINQIMLQAEDHHSPCPMVRRLFEEKFAEVERQIAELTQLKVRMQEAMSAWEHMPDGDPNGHTICRLIEYWEQESNV